MKHAAPGLTLLLLAAATTAPTVEVASAPAPRAPVTERSLYQLDAPWTDSAGRAVRLRELAGHVQVLTLMFTTCTANCPVTVKALQMFSRRMPAESRPRTSFLLITVDPAHDTVEVLRRYRHEMKLDAARWRLLRGAASDVRELAAVLGFNYQQIDSGQFAHSNLITVLDTRGEIVHQQNGVTGAEEGLADAIRRAAVLK